MSSDPLSTRVLRQLRRVVRNLRYAARRATRRSLRIHIENRWRLGDEVLALPFYELVAETFPRARITVSVNNPELLRDCPHASVNNDRTEFDCDRFIFAKDDARDVPRL